ncbi:hypothetical protein BY996DRAFT_6605513 [Phakopsora pachyrhizi]|nr:hypothetical protein BY996DRAFT_6605513 [Phakopsora pachyrhizi]
MTIRHKRPSTERFNNKSSGQRAQILSQSKSQSPPSSSSSSSGSDYYTSDSKLLLSQRKRDKRDLLRADRDAIKPSYYYERCQKAIAQMERSQRELEVGEEIRFENGGSRSRTSDLVVRAIKANDQQYARQRRDDQQVLIESWTMTEQQQSQVITIDEREEDHNFERGGLFVLDGWLDYERSFQGRDQHIDGQLSLNVMPREKLNREEASINQKITHSNKNEIAGAKLEMGIQCYQKKEKKEQHTKGMRRALKKKSIAPVGSTRMGLTTIATILGYVKRATNFPGRELALVTVPCQVQGFISKFENLKCFQPAYDKQTGCSRILIKVFNNEKSLEKLAESEKWVDGVWELFEPSKVIKGAGESL